MQAPDLVIGALRGLGLGPTSAATLVDATVAQRIKRPGETLYVRGEAPTSLSIVIGGLLKAARNVDAGAAQTVALYTPGDLVGCRALALGREPATVVAVTATRLSAMPLARLKPLMRADPALAEAFCRSTAREVAILQEWLVGMGRRTAVGQIAHLFCELALRMRRAGLAHGDTLDFPLTQAELADVAGLSPVHVNRVLQALRSEGLIELTRGHFRTGDWDGLVAAADFDPSYLDLPATVPEGAHAPLLFSSPNAARA